MTRPDRSTAADGAIVAADDAPIPYLQRVRTYYQALGYGAPYEWAHGEDVPFAPLRPALSAARVAIVTTAAPRRAGQDTSAAAGAYNAAAKFFALYSGATSGADPD